MTQRETGADQLLGALGDLQRSERAELARLEGRACELAAREPERLQAFEARLVHELFTEAAQPRPSQVHAVLAVRSRRTAKLWLGGAGSVAMAAAALLWVARPADHQRFETAYTLVVPAADARERSAAVNDEPRTAGPGDAAGVYSVGRTLTFTLRPATRYEGALRVACYAAAADKVIRLDPQVEQDPAGGARVILSTSPLSAGSWQLLFYVAPLTAAEVSESQVRARQCPEDTRCLSFDASFVRPEAL